MTSLIEFPPEIDTLPRRILATASCLGEVTADSDGHNDIPADKIKDAIKIGWELKKKSGGVIQPTAIIEANLYYDPITYKQQSGNLLASVLELSDKVPSEIPPLMPSEEGFDLLMGDEVESLEQLLVWDCGVLAASTYPDYSFVVEQAFQTEKPPRVNLKVNLPFDYQIFRLSHSLLAAVEQVVLDPIFFVDEIYG